MESLTSPLTDTELNLLGRLLDRATPGAAMTPSEIDGFFCALACGPSVRSLNEYFDYIMGPDSEDGRSFHPVLADPRRIAALLTRHWNTIAATLMAGEPYFPVFDRDENENLLGHEWIDGFVQGMDMDKAEWDHLIRDKHNWQSVAMPLLLLAEANPEIDLESKAANITSESRIEILAAIVASLAAIFRYFHGDRKSATGRNGIK